MEKEIKVIIGSNFGDEGKGLITDFFASKGDSLVVRFNGGAQAGHTVVTPEGKRHVFSHFGSGTFLGAPTYLSRFFVVNPMLFVKEWKELEGKGIALSVVYCDPSCRVTTPFDMLLNQVIEENRGSKRHGSCGIGFHETIVRHNTCPLTVSDLFNRKYLASCLNLIKESYVQNRLESLGLLDIYKDIDLDVYLEDVKFLVDRISTLTPNLIAMTSGRNFDFNIIFEGAQGLLLDADNLGYFPHVTCSKTGLHNVLLLAEEFSLKGKLDITYVTRCYTTRHGSGYLPNEIEEANFREMYPSFSDSTNVNNKYQGSLRFGLLDLDLLSKSIEKDSRGLDVSLAITCLDQAKDFFEDKKFSSIMSCNGIKKVYLSYGPTRGTVKELK